MTPPETVFVLQYFQDPKNEYFAETRPGYALDDAVEDIASGQLTDIHGVYVAFNGRFEDESEYVCDRIIKQIVDGRMVDRSAIRFIDYCEKLPREWEDAA
jgi:hypothetical protein